MSRDRVNLLLSLREYSWNKEEWQPPLAAALEGVGPAEAAWRPPGAGNSIWQTLRHINHYNERILARLTGTKPGQGLPNNDATFGDPGSPEDAAGWQAEADRARSIAEGLSQALSQRSDTDLDQAGTSSTLAEVLVPWSLHDAYHTGQIVLLRKMQGSWPASR